MIITRKAFEKLSTKQLRVFKQLIIPNELVISVQNVERRMHTSGAYNGSFYSIFLRFHIYTIKKKGYFMEIVLAIRTPVLFTVFNGKIFTGHNFLEVSEFFFKLRNLNNKGYCVIILHVTIQLKIFFNSVNYLL